MSPDFVNWIKDLEPTKWVLYGQAFGSECAHGQIQAFSEWLEDTYRREENAD